MEESGMTESVLRGLERCADFIHGRGIHVPDLIPVSANSQKNGFHWSDAAAMIASDSSTVKL